MDLARDQFTVAYDASVVLTDQMNETIVELGYRPKIVQSLIDLGAAGNGSSGPLPEVVAIALDEAKESGQLVFVDFYAEWCGACKTMHRTTFKDPEVEKVFERFVFIKVDADHDPDAAKYFDVIGLPTLVALKATGEEVYRHIGPIGSDHVKKFAHELSLLADEAE
ncbi:MAG: thioredoxin family protein [Gammaproteobacteria bacterium]|nr:thioredoxin family protein [Gammaproteobacteria bacterium]MCZ6855319.1 thioredoxin family protein [Gammaproteobacteria bacterium]